jgi:hypothetical protein
MKMQLAVTHVELVRINGRAAGSMIGSAFPCDSTASGSKELTDHVA